MSIVLGSSPHTLEVKLTKNADFIATLQNTVGPWDAGIAIELRFGAEVWSAVVSGANAVFHVDKALVNTMLQKKDSRVTLFYIDGADEVPWGVGTFHD